MGSVSYTHLRAHETVLDLVCRLLLEKKRETPEGKEGRWIVTDADKRKRGEQKALDNREDPETDGKM